MRCSWRTYSSESKSKTYRSSRKNAKFRIHIAALYIVHITRCNGIWVRVFDKLANQWNKTTDHQTQRENAMQTFLWIFQAGYLFGNKVIVYLFWFVYYLWSVCTLDLYICVVLTFIDDSIFLLIWNENTIECHYSTIKTTTMILQNSICCK